jgi:GDPmannose 4,6-dehydratase
MKALIFGIGGQDGSYLAEHLLARGYEVHGTYRRSSLDNLLRLYAVRDRLVLHQADLADGIRTADLISGLLPDEIYNEADQDHVGASIETPEVSLDITAGGPLRILETLRRLNGRGRHIKFFQPVTALMFDKDADAPQTEESKLGPNSPYACAKTHAFHLCQYYRKQYGLHASTGIFYTHDSPRRGRGYLLQDICEKVGTVRDVLVVGDKSAEIDIGFAGDYMDAAYRILQLSEPDDYIVAIGYTVTVEALAKHALGLVGKKDVVVENDPDYPKGLKQGNLKGDIRKLAHATGWLPKTTPFQLLEMILPKYMDYTCA